MAVFRRMMREGIGVIEEAITNKVHNSIQDIKEELKQEREARMKLEERITKLEEGKGAQKFNPTLDDADFVEKGKVVIGGFSDLDGEEAEKLARSKNGVRLRALRARQTWHLCLRHMQKLYVQRGEHCGL